jgi:iron-sulfur cluster assembly protein CyaY
MDSEKDEAAFDQAARDELHAIEDALADVDPDDVEITTSDGILRLDLRDGTKVVINSHRAARQIWMAAVSTAWHFDPAPEGRWIATKTGDDLRRTVTKLIVEHAGVTVSL